VYWSGTFVGPQISKLMPKDALKQFVGDLQTAFLSMHEKLNPQEIEHGQALLLQIRRLLAAFFVVLSLLKHTNKITLLR
jgi:hypothetical protein